jgi:tRNA nucleotidyltransferase (CCA-adding enzyme)
MTQFQINSDRFSHLLSDGVIDLFDVFAASEFELRIVGGFVRDVLQNKSPKDVDVATDATPEQVMTLLDAAGIRHEPTGLQHGTVSAIIDNEAIEITTLRIDTDHDGRHATVQFTDDWKLDSGRRDLTFNALSMTVDGTVFDFFDGATDLKNNVARFVGDADARIKEDFLRMLRFFRFQGRFENPNWDAATLEVVKANAAGLANVSGERVWSELKKMLAMPNRCELVLKMMQCDVLKAHEDFDDSFLDASTDAVTNFAQLCAGDENMAFDNATHFGMSRVESDKLMFLTKNFNREFEHTDEFRKMLSNPKFNRDHVLALAQMNLPADTVDWLANLSVPVFPVTGKDLLARGDAPGKTMGNTLAVLRTVWEDSDFQLTKNKLLER